MRGLWVATIKNIDWPSKAGLPVETQKEEAIKILDKAKSLNFNAIFLQVRPSSDALYQSSYEPWSAYLTGTQGQAPIPFYDPLKFWIEQAHQRGLELHAWINPYRASMSVNETLADNHPVKHHPNWFVTYNGRYQFDPGIPDCRDHIGKVITELVGKYNIDGIHLDDYFYPYPANGEDFADSLSFAKYNPKQYNIEQKNQWRRENVDVTIENISQIIKQTNPRLAFGISPFGVWRNATDDPNGSNTNAGITNYDHLHADILKWLQEDWIDYVAPQIYWARNHKSANFNTLINWWADHSNQKPLFIGHALYRVNKEGEPWNSASEILAQIDLSRSTQGVSGSIHFSANHLFRELKGVQDSLLKRQYKYQAIVPPVVSQETHSTEPVILKRLHNGIKWTQINRPNNTPRYIVYAYKANAKDPLNNGANILNVTHLNQLSTKEMNLKPGTWYIKVSALDKTNHEWGTSLPVKLQVKR